MTSGEAVRDIRITNPVAPGVLPQAIGKVIGG